MTPMRPELPREFVASHKRRRMMEDWATFCATVEMKGGSVTPINRKTAA